MHHPISYPELRSRWDKTHLWWNRVYICLVEWIWVFCEIWFFVKQISMVEHQDKWDHGASGPDLTLILPWLLPKPITQHFGEVTKVMCRHDYYKPHYSANVMIHVQRWGSRGDLEKSFLKWPMQLRQCFCTSTFSYRMPHCLDSRVSLFGTLPWLWSNH